MCLCWWWDPGTRLSMVVCSAFFWFLCAVLVWNSHSTVHKIKGGKVQDTRGTVVFYESNTIWLLNGSLYKSLGKGKFQGSISLREKCLSFSLKSRWLPPWQKTSILPRGGGRGVCPTHHLPHVEGLFQIHSGIKGFCRQPWESNHLWHFLWGKVCFEFWMTDF